MRKIIHILLVIITFRLLIGCSKDDNVFNASGGPICGIVLAPNPVSQNVTCTFYINQNAYITGTLENLTGTAIMTFWDGYFEAGQYNVTINSEYMTNGYYIIKCQSGKYVYTKLLEIRRN